MKEDLKKIAVLAADVYTLLSQILSLAKSTGEPKFRQERMQKGIDKTDEIIVLAEKVAKLC